MQMHVHPSEQGRDWNALMRAILLLALTAFLARLILTGQIVQYIHPRFTWFTASAGFGTVLMAAGQLARGLKGVSAPSGPFRTRLYVALTAVLCAGFLLRPHTFGADLAGKQGLNVTNRSTATMPGQTANRSRVDTAAPGAGGPAGSAQAQPAPGQGTGNPGQTAAAPPVAPAAGTAAGSDSRPAPPAADDLPPAALPQQAKTAAELVNNTAVITPGNFVAWMTKLYGDPTPFIGKRVTMDGFAFYPPNTSGELFAVTRLVVTCHVAHAAPDGLLAYLPGTERPKEDSWHRVEGVLEAYTYEGMKTLRIRIETMTAIAQPADPYIYP